MLKIATHNSATGERGSWWSTPLTPFAKTQSKTIREQYESGCRLFDIRVKKIKTKWRMCHGWWFTKRTADSIFAEINSFDESCAVTITYEGKGKHNEEFLEYVKDIKSKYTNIRYGAVAVKYGKNSKGLKVQYETLIEAERGWIECGCISKFLALNGKRWQTYIPIPWLWKKIYFNKPQFSEDYYTYVDFL